MKGIILAGGSGTRLYPLTMVTSKQLLPVYNKPMIYYPLSTLMLARIRDILVISTPEDTPRIRQLLGDGSAFGLRLNYAVQARPEGLAQAFLIGRDFIGDEPCAMILGDNIFYGNGLGEKLSQAGETAESGEATIFGYYVEDPERFGVMEFETGVSRQENAESVRVIGVEEKPQKPRSNYAIVGLYFYPAGVVNMAERVRPSARGELEITSLNEMYLHEGRLQAQLLGRGFTWLDAGTFDSLRRATNFVCMLEEYQGMTISAPEEIAFRLGWIDEARLRESAEKYGKSPYGAHLRNVLEGRIIL
jgi:glucose-1-phosphate thymidylyltransferase